MVAGALTNAAVTAFAGACYAYVGVRILRERRSAAATATFLLTVAALLLLGGARQVAAAFGAYGLDLAIWYVAIVPAALAVVPLVYVVARLLATRGWIAPALAGALAVTATVGIAATYLGGADGPLVSEWGTDYTLRSPIAVGVVLFAILLPGLVCAVALEIVGARTRGPEGRRARLLGRACGFYFLVFTADALGLDGIALIAARLALAASALVVYAAYMRRAPD